MSHRRLTTRGRLSFRPSQEVSSLMVLPDSLCPLATGGPGCGAHPEGGMLLRGGTVGGSGASPPTRGQLVLYAADREQIKVVKCSDWIPVIIFIETK